jgi:hypothetical protein
LNAEFYLDEEQLLKGYDGTCGKSKTLVKGYAMYSDELLLDRRLSDDVIAEIYRREMMTVTKEKTYMGIWQMHSLSSVLKMPVLSIYPKHGNPAERAHLNRMVYPRDGRSDLKAHMLWTTTGMDMNNNHWIPNHFVPVLSIEISESNTDEYL